MREKELRGEQRRDSRSRARSSQENTWGKLEKSIPLTGAEKNGDKREGRGERVGGGKDATRAGRNGGRSGGKREGRRRDRVMGSRDITRGSESTEQTEKTEEKRRRRGGFGCARKSGVRRRRRRSS